MRLSKISAVFALSFALLLSGCSSDSSTPSESLPKTPESVAESTPEAPVETVDFSVNEEFGITATGPELTDQFGTFNQVAVDPASKVYTYAPEVLAADVTATFTAEQIESATRASTNFVLTQYIDNPLVWDDSDEVKSSFINSTIPMIDATYADAFKDAFNNTAEGYFVIDSDYGSWRTGERSLTPVPYEPGAARYALTYFEVKDITLFEGGEGVRIYYEIVYERDVLGADGQHYAEVNSAEVGHVMSFTGPGGSVQLSGWKNDSNTTYVERP